MGEATGRLENLDSRRLTSPLVCETLVTVALIKVGIAKSILWLICVPCMRSHISINRSSLYPIYEGGHAHSAKHTRLIRSGRMGTLSGRAYKTPLLEVLQQHAREQTTPMHIPGHKQGSGISEEFAAVLSSHPLRIDLTELPGARFCSIFGPKTTAISCRGLSLSQVEVQKERFHPLVGLDNLASPEGPIAESQKLAAQAFGSEHCWFLVNGTTLGLQVAFTSIEPNCIARLL